MNWPEWENLYDQARSLYLAESTDGQFTIMIAVLVACALMLQGFASLLYLPSTIRNARRRGD